MSSWRPTHSQYTHQQIFTTFGDLISYFNEMHLTHISQELLESAIIDRVGYYVHRFISTTVISYEELSEEQPWTDKEEWEALILERIRD